MEMENHLFVTAHMEKTLQLRNFSVFFFPRGHCNAAWAGSSQAGLRNMASWAGMMDTKHGANGVTMLYKKPGMRCFFEKNVTLSQRNDNWKRNKVLFISSIFTFVIFC